MKRKPRSAKQALFSRDLIVPSLAQGTIVFGILLGVFLISLRRGLGEFDARALTFTTLIVANLGLILVNRSWSRTILEGLRIKNLALWWVLTGAALVMGVVLYVPAARNLFRFSFLHPIDLAISLSAGLLSILWFEAWKIHRRRLVRSSVKPDLLKRI